MIVTSKYLKLLFAAMTMSMYKRPVKDLYVQETCQVRPSTNTKSQTEQLQDIVYYGV